MKKTAENRYPHSATLFKFCKEALEIRYEGNVKVIDQDVGSILGYDPADCSHWKKGKKNIHALATLKSIAEHLNLDERLLIDVASGKIGLEEAIFEYKGYGSFGFTGGYMEGLKKDFFKNPSKWQKSQEAKTFEDLFDVNRSGVVAAAEQILKSGRFDEAPIYIPEVYQMFPNILLETDSTLTQSFRVEKQEFGEQLKVTIFYKAPEMRPYIRFLIARQLFKFLCESNNEVTRPFSETPPEIQEIQANIFAGVLLAPGYLLRKEIERIDSSIDIILQLSETFWISHSLMNQRLRDYMKFLS